MSKIIDNKLNKKQQDIIDQQGFKGMMKLLKSMNKFLRLLCPSCNMKSRRLVMRNQAHLILDEVKRCDKCRPIAEKMEKKHGNY